MKARNAGVANAETDPVMNIHDDSSFSRLQTESCMGPSSSKTVTLIVARLPRTRSASRVRWNMPLANSNIKNCNGSRNTRILPIRNLDHNIEFLKGENIEFRTQDWKSCGPPFCQHRHSLFSSVLHFGSAETMCRKKSLGPAINSKSRVRFLRSKIKFGKQWLSPQFDQVLTFFWWTWSPYRPSS